MSENKRLGRETELKAKVKVAADRFEDVFGRPLSPALLKDFLDYSERQNRIQFLIDRVGVLSDADVVFLRNVLGENYSEKTLAEDKPVKEAVKELDIDDLDDLESEVREQA